MHGRKPPKIDTLIIIGNGFDIWQGLNTRYSDFQKYYLSHRDAILKKLHIKPHTILAENGTRQSFSDVELIYGDPFDPGELDNAFWGSFETSLAQVDAEQINWFFGKDRRGLSRMKRSIRNAKCILREAFCNWIATIPIEERESEYTFGDNCLFINFNYTDTLRKRFGVDENAIYHIHGSADDKESIIFGHSNHPQLPEPLLNRIGGRFRGLYYIDELLYETDKHAADNVQYLCMFLALRGVICEEIKDIYVLGQSMSPPDLEYYAFLQNATSVRHPEPKSKEKPPEESELEPFERIQYLVDSVGYGNEESDTYAEGQEAVIRQFEREQEARNAYIQKQFLKTLTKGKDRKAIEQESLTIIQPERTEDANWHITYHKDDSLEWEKHVTEELEIQSVRFYPSIEECLLPFKGKRS